MGDYKSGTSDNGYAKTEYRNGEGKSERGRDISGDRHSVLTNVEGARNVESSVGDIRYNGKSYKLELSSFKGGLVGEDRFLFVSTSDDPSNNIISKGAAQFTDEQKKMFEKALSKGSAGGEALTYDEAREILIQVLPDASVKDRGGRQ